MITWKQKFNKKYNHPKGASHSLSEVSKDTGVSKKGLQQIYNKGIGAYKTNPQSVRPNVTSKEQWAMARVYSSVMGGKASKIDAKELKMAKGGIAENTYITKVVLSDFDKKGYFGQYKKVFNAFNKGSLGLTEGAYELDSSGQRDNEGNYILLISQDTSNGDLVERLSKIKGISFEEIYIDKKELNMAKGGNVEEINWSEYYKEGGITKSSMSKEMQDRLFDENGDRKIDRESIRVLTDYVNSLPQTKSMYYNESTDKYSPSRQKVHKEILKEFQDKLVCIESDEPIAILMGGSPASGKSTFLRKYAPYLLSEELLRIDADEVRSQLPEYEGWNASQTHLETKDIVNTLLSDRTIGMPCKFDVIYDGTMNNTKSYLPLIKTLRELGYKIFVVYIDNVPKDVIVKRALERYGKSGRFVPLEVIDDFFDKGKSALNEIKQKVDGYMIVDGGSNDYSIIEESGIKLPQNRAYGKIGFPTKMIGDINRNKFYKEYYERLSPTYFDVKEKGGKIEIVPNDGATDIHDEAEAITGGFLEKGGETNFNPDGKIKDKIVHVSGEAGGMLVGKRHSKGGIKALNKSTGQPLEMEGGEVVITRNAVSDNKKRSFNGKMMTNREILSSINESGGGVSFADGGQVPNDLQFDCNAEYEYGGKTMCGKDLAYALGGQIDLFEDYQSQPKELSEIVEKYEERYSDGDMDYKDTEQFLKEVNAIGYTFDSGLDNSPYDLREMAMGGVTTAIVTNPNEAMADLQSTYGFGDVYAKGGLAKGYHKMPDGTIMKDSDHYAKGGNIYKEARQELGKAYLDNLDKFAEGGLLTRDEFPLALVEAKFIKSLGGSTDAKLYEYKGKRFVVKAGATKGQSVDEFTANQIYYILDIPVPRSILLTDGNLAKEYIEKEEDVDYDNSIQIKKILRGFVADALLGNWDVYKNDNIILEEGTRTAFRIDNGGSLRYRARGEKKDNFGREVFELQTIKDNNPKLKPYITDKVIKEGIEKIIEKKSDILSQISLDEDLKNTVGNRISYLEGVLNEINDRRGTDFVDEDVEVEVEVEDLEVEVEETKEPSFRETFLKDEISDLRKIYNIKKRYLSEIDKGISLRNIRKYEIALDEIRLENRSFKDILNDFAVGQTTQFGDIDAKRTIRKGKSINGEKSELTQKEYDAVRSQSFLNWFGDWELAKETGNNEGVSKIINSKTKEPLVVYHGTDTKFTSWETYAKNNLHYFAKKKRFADFFATSWQVRTDDEGVNSAEIKSDNPIKGTFVYSCFLDIKNPIDFTPFGIDKVPFNDYLKYLEVKYDLDLSKIDGYNEVKNRTEAVYSWIVIRKWQQFNLFIKNNTPYDGFSFYEFIPDSQKMGFQDASLSFTAFNSNQIKFTNNTSFSKFTNDSRLEVGGLIF